MKIAVVVNEINICGGTHKQVLRLCEFFERNNIDFVICTKYYDPELSYKGFRRYNILFLQKEPQKYPSTKGKIFLKLKNRLDKYKEEEAVYRLIPDDVNIINVHDDGFRHLMNIAKRHKKTVIWQINDLPGCFGVGITKVAGDCLAWKLDRRAYIRTARRIDEITVNVTKNAERVRECLRKKASVLYCGVDIKEDLNTKKNACRAENLRLLSTGVFFPYRNYETLIEVIKKLRNQNINIRLDIVGSTLRDPEYAAKIQQLIKKYCLDNYIKIWGQVDDFTYNQLFEQSDIFAFINIEQSWGLAVFEAMSYGIPTIVSNSVGAIELLHHQEDAIIVEPTSVEEICHEIHRLINEDNYYRSISQNAKSAVRTFTWDHLYCEPLLAILKKYEPR